MTLLRARIALAATALALSAILGGCGGAGIAPSDGTPSAPVVTFPADGGPAGSAPAGKLRAPDATGTIETLYVGDAPVSIGFRPDAGFEYFAGTTFQVPVGAFPHGEDGVTLAASDLSVGDHINVWVGACRESMPVQCDVERVELAP